MGQIVFSREIDSGAGVKIDLNLTSLPSGFYFVKLQTGEIEKTVRVVKE